MDLFRISARYFGEFLMQFGYGGSKGRMFSFLYVDPETLSSHAARKGWSCDILIREEDGNYLGRLE